MRIPLLSILFIITIFLSACKENLATDILDDLSGNGSFSAKINGEDFSAEGVLVTAQYSDQTVGQILGIGAAMLPSNGVTRAIALAIVSLDDSGINAGETYTATSTAKSASGEYSLDNNNIDIKAVSSNTDVATVTITAIDYDKKLVSGTFSFDGTDEDAPNTVYEVRDGKFENVSFD